MANPFIAGIQALESLLHPTISSSYKPRFWIQVACGSILLIACLVYLVLTYLDSRRTAKPVALLKIQRVASGRFIVVNALVFLVLFDALAAILMLVMRYKLYTIYYGNGTPYNRLVLGMLSWLPLTLVAWAYSFGNIAAMMQIKTRDYGGPSNRAVFAYNLAFFATLIAAFGVALPCCILANAEMNKILRLGQTLLDLLYKANTPGSVVSLSDLQRIRTLEESIFTHRNSMGVRIRVVLAIAASISLLTAVSATAAFWFVAFLSEFPNDEPMEASTTPRSPAFSHVSQEDHEVTTFLGLGAAPESRPLSSATRMKSPSAGHGRPQNIALKRLYKDLMLSVPIVLILSVYAMVLAILTGIHMIDSDWREFMHDGMSWTSPIFLIIVVAFLHNLIKYRNSSPLSTSQAIQLSRSPGNSPRQALVGSFNLANGKRDEEEDDGQSVIRVEACVDPFRIRSDDSNVEVNKQMKGEGGINWVEMPAGFERKQNKGCRV